jgi:hypothetical protein
MVLIGTRSVTDPWRFQKHTRSQGPLLTGITRHQRSYDPVRLPPGPPPKVQIEAATLIPNGSPPITRTTMRTCRAHYPGGSKRVHRPITSPSHAAFPDLWAGRHPHWHFRGLLRLHSRYGPHARSTAQGSLCHGASTRPVTRPRRPSATSSIDNLLGGTLLHRCFALSGRNSARSSTFWVDRPPPIAASTRSASPRQNEDDAASLAAQ